MSSNSYLNESEITVLFVDEDQDFLDLASRLLELETDQIDLVTESSPEAALDRLHQLDVDCVVSDYKMTEMDGLELLERVRSKSPLVPFILFTGRGGEKIASEAISMGATDYIVKTGSPDQYTVLANRIEKAVTRARAEVQTTQQKHLNAIIQTITSEVIHEPTRDQIEQTACDGLLDIDPYAFVMISTPTTEEAHIHPTTWRVADTTDVDPEALTTVVGADIQSPERTAFETEGPVVIDEIHNESRFEQWQSAVTGSEIASVLCLPITYGNISYGVMSIYATMPDIFSSLERTILGGFGELLGFAISNAELRQGMFSVTMTEIELTVRDSSAGLICLAESLGTRVIMDTIVPRADGCFSMSLAIEEPSVDEEQIDETITDILSPEDTTVTTTADGITRWAVVMETCPVDLFLDRGIRIERLTATEERGRIVLTAPPDMDIRDVVEIAESQFDEVELTERRSQTDQNRPVSSVDGIDGELTSRQLEVFETAYRHGFFEWPREMNTEEIASLLDISQPALSRHLRNIQRTIAESVIDEPTDKPAPD